MKRFFLLAFVFSAVSINGYSQEKIAPRTDFSVSLSENVLTIKPGETKQLTVSILRSKSYARSQAKLGLSSSLPDGLAVAYDQAEGMFDSSVATFTAAADSKAGEYQVILKTTLNNKVKGSIVKVVVENGLSKDALSSN
jgi:hypothetical protein